MGAHSESLGKFEEDLKTDGFRNAVFKEEASKIETDDTATTTSSLYERPDAASLTEEHKDYLLQRHGTLDLDPIPFPTDADPYNWPQRKKVVNLLLVAFHAMMATFNAASIIAGYAEIAEEFQTSVTRVSYLTSIQIALIGTAPLIWRPLCNRFGRRPIFLFSLFAGCVCNIGCSVSQSYASLAVCQALVAFFVSPAAAMGSAVVAESFFKKDRAKYVGVWTLMVTLGVPIAPFIFGFVAYRVGFRWIFRTLAIVHAIELVLYAFFGPETRYLGPRYENGLSAFKAQYLSLRRIDPSPFNAVEIVHPLAYFGKPCVLLAAVAYAMVFLFASVLITVETPQLFIAKFDFNAQQVGLQFLGIIIGSLIGEQIGGALSDRWMNAARARRAANHRPQPEPEYRLWLSYPGVILAIVGLVVYLVQIDRAQPLQWNVTPLVGSAIASGGNQLITTVLVTYAVDCYLHDAASIGVFITFVRQMWGFIGPFWFPYMFDNVGLRGSAGVGSGCMVVAGLLPIVALHIRGKGWR